MADLRRPVDDEFLIAGALRGDEEALGSLLARDQEWAYNVAYRVLGQEADARDAVQDAFLQTVRALRGQGSPPRSIESYRPWLRRVVSNAAITQIRRRPSTTIVSANVLDRAPPAAGQTEPGREIEREETRAQVLQALLALPATQRVALALRELLDASYDEIAEALDLPRTAVGTLLFRARAGFRAAYDRVPETAPPLDCPDLAPLFASIVDDQPRPTAWQELEEHLRTCDRCQGDLEGQRRARRLYAVIPLLALPAGWEPAVAALQGVAAGAATGGAADQAVSAASEAAAAATSAAGTTVSSGAAASTAAGGSASGGLIAGGVGVKVALATVATVAVVGVATVAGPLVGLGSDPTPAASPSPAVASSPAASPSPGSSPGATVISGSTAGPALAAGATPLTTPGPGTPPAASPAVVTTPGPGSVAAPIVSPVADPARPPTLPASSPTPTAAP